MKHKKRLLKEYVEYSFEEYQRAYTDWVIAGNEFKKISLSKEMTEDRHKNRREKWNRYCDMRDNVSFGTSAKKKFIPIVEN